MLRLSPGDENTIAAVTSATYIKLDTRALLEKTPKSLQSFEEKKKKGRSKGRKEKK